MFNFRFRPFIKINKRYISQTKFIDTINNFTKKNIKYIDRFELVINNPKKLNIFNPSVFEGNILFCKDNIRIYKKFQNNNVEKLFDEISQFISNEIKL